MNLITYCHHLLFCTQESYQILVDELRKVSENYGERLLETRHNPISLGLFSICCDTINEYLNFIPLITFQIMHNQALLYYTIPYYTILYYTILYYTILYYTILYYTILCYTILYYIILYYTILL